MENLKDTLYKTELIEDLANALLSAYPEFSKKDFTKAVFAPEWASLELKQRMRHITRRLYDFLPNEYEKAIQALMGTSEKVNGFIALSFSDFVELYGQNNWNLSMEALACFTKSCSSEFAIRPFLDTKPEQGMKQMLAWSKDENEHVRRLSSEGCRPRLPWGMALKKFIADPSPILPVLENLKNDPSAYVRKSVANNLNDISKDHPEIVLDICERWQGKSKHTDWIIKHACRTMLKKGNKRAMILFGFGNPQNIRVTGFKAEKKKLKIGEHTSLEFEISIHEKEKQKLRLEYIVHFVKANGKTSPKVFQINEKEWDPGKHPQQFKHSFLDRTTRKHYQGQHRFEVVVNGDSKAETRIELI